LVLSVARNPLQMMDHLRDCIIEKRMPEPRGLVIAWKRRLE